MRIKSVILLFIAFFTESFNNLYTNIYKNGCYNSVIKENKNFNNLYKVNKDLYRAEQPSKKGYLELEKIGIKTIINLRGSQTDKIANSNLVLKHIPIKTKQISYKDILNVLKTISNSEKPVLIHCKHGSDRTGCVVAAYRMVYENWTKKDAIKEFKDKKFGYHKIWFPNIIYLFNSLNISKLKIELGVN